MPENTLIMDNHRSVSNAIGITLGIVILIIVGILICYYFDNIKKRSACIYKSSERTIYGVGLDTRLVQNGFVFRKIDDNILQKIFGRSCSNIVPNDDFRNCNGNNEVAFNSKFGIFLFSNSPLGITEGSPVQKFGTLGSLPGDLLNAIDTSNLNIKKFNKLFFSKIGSDHSAVLLEDINGQKNLFALYDFLNDDTKTKICNYVVDENSCTEAHIHSQEDDIEDKWLDITTKFIRIP